MSVVLLNAVLLASATSNMDDVIEAVAAFTAPPECPRGCMDWTAALNVSEQAASFADPSVLPALGAGCAIPGRALHSLTQPVAPAMTPMEQAAFYGPICPCRIRSHRHPDKVEFVTCTAPLFVPEQINLQLANSSTVVASFVTHELAPPTSEPVARLGLARDGPPTATLNGVSHWFETSNVNGSKACVEVTGSARRCSVRNLTMHFIRFPSLEPRQTYSYQVRSGGSAGVWSQAYTFRAPYGHGTAVKSGGSNSTRVAICESWALREAAAALSSRYPQSTVLARRARPHRGFLGAALCSDRYRTNRGPQTATWATTRGTIWGTSALTVRVGWSMLWCTWATTRTTWRTATTTMATRTCKRFKVRIGACSERGLRKARRQQRGLSL